MLAKVARILVIATFLAGLIAIPAAALTTVGISGTVTLNGLPLKGVTVKISGTTFSAVSSSTGNYHIGSIPVGTAGTLVASYPNYSFTPASISFPALTVSLTGQNFAAKLVNFSKYSISGMITFNGVGLPNVTVTFLTFSAITSSTGAYTLSGIPAASTGHIVPKLTGYAFTPTYIAITNLAGNLTGKNFTAALALTISGKVTDQATLLPLSGVVVTCGTHSATSGSTGTYTIRNLPVGTSCTLTPSMSGKTFTPATYSIVNMTTSIHSQNFVAAP